jgi:hypothetical protein
MRSTAYYAPELVAAVFAALAAASGRSAAASSCLAMPLRAAQQQPAVSPQQLPQC